MVKITLKVQNFIESLCILYPLHYWSLCIQRRCANLLFIITKPSTTQWAYTDSSTLTCTITRHAMGWGGVGGILQCKATNLGNSVSDIHETDMETKSNPLPTLYYYDCYMTTGTAHWWSSRLPHCSLMPSIFWGLMCFHVLIILRMLIPSLCTAVMIRESDNHE